ncbi:MAG: DUF4062 domain-containing protein [Clostridiales bacterium]|nr:DUF4062 domain-containing protein [Clostridiales bacterium]MDD6935410.1 DUF4062 domain-containing protein [Clostridiales bacterium]MDY2961088.1 DUF4062 domain-containing protein [Oscillospiraceae bacterium]
MSSTSSSPWRIFVSSTKEDLIPYREVVETVLTGMEHIPLGMEYFVSSPDSPIDVCLATVRRSQLYIVIVGMRYGSIEEGSGKSFTELEYDEAVKNKIPVLAFIIDEEQCPILPKFVDVGEKAEKLKQFKAKLNSSYLVSRFASIDNLKQLVEKSVRQAIDKISADKAEKNAAQSNEVALADYIAGAKLFRRFALLPQRYSGREVVLRIRMDGQFGTWKMRDEFFTAFGFDPGDTLFGNDATVIGINMDDLDERARTIDFFAGSENADWILDNEITTGTIFEGKFKFAYEQVEGVVSRSYGDTAASIAALILIEGKTVIGKEAGYRKAKSIRSEFYG